MQEIWKNVTVEPFCDFYMVSNLGNVKKIQSYNNSGGLRNVDKVLHQYTNSLGYKFVVFQILDLRKSFFVHRLVALAFVSGCYGCNYVNHKDCNKENNYYLNLEWCTNEYNVKHAHKNNLIPPPPTRCVYQFDKNGRFVKKWESMKNIQKYRGYSITSISQCCSGKRNSAYGYFWSFERDMDLSQKSNPRLHKRPVYQYDLDGNKIAYYPSIKTAAQMTQSSANLISSCCAGFKKSTNNYIWKYAE